MAAGSALGAVVLVFGFQLALLSRRAFLSPHVRFLVDELVTPAGGGSGEPIRLAVLGDSTVAGVGAPSADESLAGQVARRLAEASSRPVHVVGFGVSGARTASVRSEQLAQVESGRFDALLLVVGANDVTHATAPWNLGRDLAALLHASRERTPRVVLASTPAFAGTPALPEPIRSVAHAYSRVLRSTQRRAAAVAGVPLVDLATAAGPRFRGRPEAFSSDGFHPSPIGYGFWADALAPALIEALDAGG